MRVNEVESSGGNPGDWVELINNGTTSLDVSGWIFKDNVDSDVYTLPSGSTIPAGGYLTLDEAQFVFGLGTSDSARLYLADGVTLVDSYAWTAHATTSYGRCPNGTGAFTTTATPTKGTSNVCPGDLVTTPWPGGSDVATADAAGALGGDVSGLAFDATTLYAVNNGTGSLVRLLPGAGGYAIDSTRVLRYPDGTGVPDAEGVALTAAGAAGGVYVATERNNSANGISRPSILRYDVSGSGSPLSATDEWALAADLPSVAANAGLEAIAWVPDSALVAAGFRTDAGALYDPAAYAGHGSGLFFVGLEANGRIYGYALGAGGSYTRVTSFASGFPGVMDLEWDPERSSLWAVCDDTCNGRSTLHQVGGDGRFAISQAYERPAAMPNLNNEGFAIAPQSQCVGGTKPVVWSDDSNTGGHALRAGTISCTAPPASSVAGVVSAPAGPFPGACVYLYTSRSAPAASYGSCTQADGSYYLAGVTAGTYEVAVADPSGTYRTIWRATPLVVGGIVTGVDLVLTGRNPGAVAGTVTTTQGGGALSNVCAYLYPHGDATAAAYATCTLADGTFGLYDVAAGSYDLAFFDPAGVHPTRWHTGSPGGAPSQAGAVALTVTGGATRTADIALSPVTAGTVSGTVTRGTNPATAAAGVCVYLYTSPAGPAAYGTCTQSDGTWYLGEVAAGTYRVGFADPAGQLRTQWWTGGDGGATAYAGGAN
ncbi:MAG: hypothetical protein F2667_02060, partial [Actinobacteria bacterium]|nr:hypothetical protein [Actinomycetota bacterium]